jgi:hypothetical protein
MIDMSGHDFPQHVQALEAVKRGDYERARTLLSQLPDGPPWTLVRADPDVFRYRASPEELEIEQQYDLGWGIDPAFLVITPDQEWGARALERTVARFINVIEGGRELADWEHREESTPNAAWIAHTPAGPCVIADTKSSLSPERGYAMLRILVDELIAERVRASITYRPFGLAVTSSWWVPAEPGEPGERAMYIVRHVLVDVGDGRRYQAMEYISPDGGWTPDKATARQWPLDAPASDLTSLTETLSDRSDPAIIGQPTCVHLSI